MNNLKSAVILAARLDRESVIPFPLRPLNENGDTLFTRQLDILQKCGIEHITVVAGYRAELYKVYESERIRVVVNDNYRYTSSMASLACAAPYVDGDFMLLDSDVLCEARVYHALADTECANCLIIADESQKGDEAYVETSNGCVLKVSKDLHQLNSIGGEMLGISRIAFSTFRKMMLAWEENSNPWLNYEYLWMDCMAVHERRYIKYTNLIWGEADNLAGFENMRTHLSTILRRKEDPFDRENIISHLKSIMGDENVPADPPIEFIGGMTNRSFKVTLPGGVYVLRIAGLGTEGMINRDNEALNSLMSARTGVAPAILHINPKTGLKLTPYIEGAQQLTAATVQRYDNIGCITEILRNLHYSGLRFNNEFNVFTELANYERLMEQCGATMYEGYDAVRPKILALRDRLNDLGVEIRPCHNDCCFSNFIKDENGKIYLIDWEYAGMNDPMWDLAQLFNEGFDENVVFSHDNCELVLNQYFNGQVPDTAREKIAIYRILQHFLWAVWTVVKEQQGDDFGDYGPTRFRMGCNELNQLLNK